MATWPTTLPDPSAPGYGLKPQDQSVRTDMEAGNARVRRRSAARVDLLDVSWVFTDAQMATFRAWFENSSTGAAGGAAWFTVSLNTGTGSIAAISARFSGAFSAAFTDRNRWTVSARLETRT